MKKVIYFPGGLDRFANPDFLAFLRRKKPTRLYGVRFAVYGSVLADMSIIASSAVEAIKIFNEATGRDEIISFWRIR